MLCVIVHIRRTDRMHRRCSHQRCINPDNIQATKIRIDISVLMRIPALFIQFIYMKLNRNFIQSTFNIRVHIISIYYTCTSILHFWGMFVPNIHSTFSLTKDCRFVFSKSSLLRNYSPSIIIFMYIFT